VSGRPVLLQKNNGEGDLWVFPEDVLRVEDIRALLSEYSKTVIYFRDGTTRNLKPLTAAEAIATLWPEPEKKVV
jgi:hypothetical protein